MFAFQYRRSLSLAFCALVCLFASQARAGQTTVNFLGEALPEIFAPVIEAFEKANPDIKIQYQQVPFEDLNAAIQSRVGQGDSSIDVFEADTPRIPAFASKGYLKELEFLRPQILAAVPSETAINEVSYKGKLYAFPMWNATQMLFYNRDLLKKANVPEPSAKIEDRMTWEDFNELARTVQKNAGTKWGWTFQQIDRYYQLQPLFESAGAGPGLTGPDLLTPDLTGEKWVKTAAWYGSIYEEGLAPRGITAYQSYDLFSNGECPFIITGQWSINRFLKAGVNFGVVPMPYFAGGKPVTPTGSWSLALSPHAANPEAALKFLEFATLTGEGSALTVAVNPFIPNNAEGIKIYMKVMEEIEPKVGPVIDLLTYEMANTAVGRPRTIGYVAFETVMNKAFSDIRNGADAKQVLEEAQRQLTSTLRRIR